MATESSSSWSPNWVLGFLGTGKISSAVCTGYCTLGADLRPRKILVSERSVEKSTALQASFPDIVEIVSSNEEIVQRSDVVFIGLLPTVAKEVLPAMPWESCKLIVSMMAAVNFETFVNLVGNHQEKCVRTVPLPSNARHVGPILYHPENRLLVNLMKPIGTPVCCAKEDEMIPLIAVTGHISPFYLYLSCCEQFLLESGVSATASKSFTTSFYDSLASSAMLTHDSFRELAEHAATPGGLNEQAMKFMGSSVHFDIFRASLDAIRERLSKK